MPTLSRPVALHKVHTIVYHSQEGQAYAVKVDCEEQFREFGLGHFCDTSEIDGVVHFYPKGNA
ncbi:MAG: hypothetical protein COZ12_01305 [Deltaproteobacteria bacterium CG_4_10_14_3_um_filter_60_8]|nr:MAG: hypothetical protein AUK28_07960 [Desulfobacterales bacterium CG2_30_60_27]PIP44541.1 MAG: hypothetical protein COX17_00815 [Deltaproteobacteria bacterium CG23_combo_of_CG06-09_8_20_14_all_60_8]PIY24195.1 MAG: hypothetical protein COZ12_01305 [Deltaproteobacteria bacterium CG_4_10_14_3_um_filter_60_8]